MKIFHAFIMAIAASNVIQIIPATLNSSCKSYEYGAEGTDVAVANADRLGIDLRKSDDIAGRVERKGWFRNFLQVSQIPFIII